MKIYLGADHRGFELKERLKKRLIEVGEEVEDLGAFELCAGDDYADFGIAVAKRVVGGGRGVLLCGSGHGMDMVANRFGGVRSALCFNEEVARQAREHEDVNVLTIPADWVGEEEAWKMVEAFLKTEFSGEERHKRRLAKLEGIS